MLVEWNKLLAASSLALLSVWLCVVGWLCKRWTTTTTTTILNRIRGKYFLTDLPTIISWVSNVCIFCWKRECFWINWLHRFLHWGSSSPKAGRQRYWVVSSYDPNALYAGRQYIRIPVGSFVLKKIYTFRLHRLWFPQLNGDKPLKKWENMCTFLMTHHFPPPW